MRWVRTLNPKEIARRVATVRIMYLTLTILWGLMILSESTLRLNIFSFEQTVLNIVWVWVWFFCFYGLWSKKEWVVPLLLIVSLGVLLKGFCGIFIPAQDAFQLMAKLADAGFLLFGAYQLGFLRRLEVRRFLGAKGKVII